MDRSNARATLPSLPPEVLLLIVQSVSDIKTLGHLRRSSRLLNDCASEAMFGSIEKEMTQAGMLALEVIAQSPLARHVKAVTLKSPRIDELLSPYTMHDFIDDPQEIHDTLAINLYAVGNLSWCLSQFKSLSSLCFDPDHFPLRLEVRHSMAESLLKLPVLNCLATVTNLELRFVSMADAGRFLQRCGQQNPSDAWDRLFSQLQSLTLDCLDGGNLDIWDFHGESPLVMLALKARNLKHLNIRNNQGLPIADRRLTALDKLEHLALASFDCEAEFLERLILNNQKTLRTVKLVSLEIWTGWYDTIFTALKGCDDLISLHFEQMTYDETEYMGMHKGWRDSSRQCNCLNPMLRSKRYEDEHGIWELFESVEKRRASAGLPPLVFEFAGKHCVWHTMATANGESPCRGNRSCRRRLVPLTGEDDDDHFRRFIDKY